MTLRVKLKRLEETVHRCSVEILFCKKTVKIHRKTPAMACCFCYNKANKIDIEQFFKDVLRIIHSLLDRWPEGLYMSILDIKRLPCGDCKTSQIIIWLDITVAAAQIKIHKSDKNVWINANILVICLLWSNFMKYCASFDLN